MAVALAFVAMASLFVLYYQAFIETYKERSVVAGWKNSWYAAPGGTCSADVQSVQDISVEVRPLYECNDFRLWCPSPVRLCTS